MSWNFYSLLIRSGKVLKFWLMYPNGFFHLSVDFLERFKCIRTPTSTVIEFAFKYKESMTAREMTVGKSGQCSWRGAG